MALGAEGLEAARLAGAIGFQLGEHRAVLSDVVYGHLDIRACHSVHERVIL